MSDIELFKENFYHINGILFWKITRGSRAKKNNIAGKLRKDGYLDVGLFGKYYLVHRIVFALENNYLPEIVDHINHIRHDNNPNNLREADYAKNAHNSRLSMKNSSSIKGIRITRNGKYEARVAFYNKTYQVGTFSTLMEAKEAVQSFREKLHAEYTCHG